MVLTLALGHNFLAIITIPHRTSRSPSPFTIDLQTYGMTLGDRLTRGMTQLQVILIPEKRRTTDTLSGIARRVGVCTLRSLQHTLSPRRMILSIDLFLYERIFLRNYIGPLRTSPNRFKTWSGSLMAARHDLSNPREVQPFQMDPTTGYTTIIVSREIAFEMLCYSIE
jgi:hypothetical protein